MKRLILTLFLTLLGVLPVMAQKKKKLAADFSFPDSLSAPAKVTFTNRSSGGEIYEWDFGDGTTSSEVSPTHIYKRSGNYVVKLTIRQGKKSKSVEKVVPIKAPDRCLIEIETEYGTMLAELFSSTPKHRDNFVKLAEEGFYDGLLFHRVIKGFMIQGGDPLSRNASPEQMLGMGGPGYQIPAEFVDSLIHTKGAIAAARTNNPKKESSGSQFYIVQGAPVGEEQLNQIELMRNFRYTAQQREAYRKWGGAPHLDREYTVFGRVIEGLDVIDRIAAVETGFADRPKKDVWMKVRVIK
ncbi:MAG: peptidylprolyl isomerase [Saprospiraceae bacterium]|nr:peptidylprolyl isomerase [Saprospiraceae bacterium]MDW8483837.1 peptidylprolyl isomerase [Saprospiraceae bacterium]